MTSRNNRNGDSVHNNNDATVVDLYSILKLDRKDAPTEEDIHRAYRLLSTTFHPDKIPSNTAAAAAEQSRRRHGDGSANDDTTSIQQIFLDFKKAHEILIDPVLRLAYDHYGEEGVMLIKRLQMQQRERAARKEAAAESSSQEHGDDEEDDDEDDVDDDDDDGDVYNLYDRLERLLVIGNNPLLAKEVLRRFMEQHDYHENLSEENQVHLNLSMEFPTVVNLRSVMRMGKQYLKFAESRVRAVPVTNEEEREYFKERLMQERRLVDYQFNKIKDSQQAEVGFTLSSVQPRNVTAMTGGAPIQPKWSMAMGGTTHLVYPDVLAVMKLAGQKDEDVPHSASMFVNTVYQPIPATQINLTANLSSSDSHQFVLGS
jgi:curved DNA-binding protein CbpA